MQTNRVPLPWVLMLIFLLILIIVDRGLYLRKAVTLKLIFQHLLVLLVHVYIFFVLPSFSDKSTDFLLSPHLNPPLSPPRSVQENTVAQLFYVVKCIYFLLSAWQIRNGYPSQVPPPPPLSPSFASAVTS